MEGSSYEHWTAEASGSHSYLYPVVKCLLADLPKNSIVLDMGCGNGSFISLFSQTGWKLYGTDFSTAGIEVAKKHFPNISFFLADSQANISKLKEQTGDVDVVISTEVIEHVYDPRAFLRNAYEFLSPNGTLVITTPYHGYLKNVMLAVANKMDHHYTALRDHGHIKFFSRNTLTKVLEETGFHVEQFRGAGRFPYLWKSMVLVASKPLRANRS